MIVFVDTNIWVYAADDTEPHKQAIAQAYLTRMANQNTLALSTQVMQEFFNVTTGKGKKRLPHEVALGHLEDMSVHTVIESSVQGILGGTPSFWKRRFALKRMCLFLKMDKRAGSLDH
jgi:predicted nucleic acid-binding protein